MVRLIRIRYWRPSHDTALVLYRVSKIFLMALGLSALLHLVLLALAPRLFKTPNGNVPEPNHVRFFARHDLQLTRPIELRKLPMPKRQPVQRQTHLAVARHLQAPIVGAFSTIDHSRQLSLPTPSLTFDPIGTGNVGPILGPTVVPSGNPVGITRYDAGQVDLHLGLLDANSLDIGRYQAVVVQDPADRQGIRGFVKFGMAMSSRASHTTEHLDAEGLLAKTTTALVKALGDFTGLHGEVVREIALDDRRLLELPILLVPVGTPNEAEKENLTRYLLGGGFIMGGFSLIEAEVFEGLETYGGLVRGRDFWKQALPEDHPIYHSFFDFHGGVGVYVQMSRDSGGALGLRNTDTITGYFIKGRLVGIDPIDSGQWVLNDTPGKALHDIQLAINVVVYALTQEGTIAQRRIQMK